MNNWVKLGLGLVVAVAFLEMLRVEASVSPCEIVHISQCIFKLSFIYLSKSAKFVIGEP